MVHIRIDDLEKYAHDFHVPIMLKDGIDFLTDYIKKNNITCPNCGKQDFTEIRKFNLMFKTFMGVTEDAKSEVYLRPETAQRNVYKL